MLYHTIQKFSDADDKIAKKCRHSASRHPGMYSRFNGIVREVFR